jgi:AGZA family xanthine/uracil permease-like MFS transporter
MGLNGYFAYGVVAGLGVTWQVALAATFVEGVVSLLLAGAGARRLVLEAIPATVRHGAMAGIGLFLAFIGLRNGGLVEASPATLVKLADPSSPGALLMREVKPVLWVLSAGLLAFLFFLEPF